MIPHRLHPVHDQDQPEPSLLFSPAETPVSSHRQTSASAAMGLRTARRTGSSARPRLGLPSVITCATKSAFCTERSRYWGPPIAPIVTVCDGHAGVLAIARGDDLSHGWIGCLLNPAGSGARVTGCASPGRRLPLSNGPPCHPGLQPAPGCPSHEASAKVHSRSPQPAFPAPVAPGGTGPPNLSLSSAPGRTKTLPRTSGRGRAMGTARTTSLASASLHRRTHSLRATTRRKARNGHETRRLWATACGAGTSGCGWTPGNASCPQVPQNVSLLGENQNSVPLSGLTCLHILPSPSSCFSAWYTRACRVSSRLAISSCICQLRTGRSCCSMYT